MDFVAAAALGPAGLAVACCGSCVKNFPWRTLILFLSIFTVFSLMAFVYLEIQFSFSTWANFSTSIIFGAILAAIGSLSVYARCIYTLMFPSLFGKIGRRLVLSQVGWIIINVPVRNMLENLRRQSQTSSCLSQQLSEQLTSWKTIFQSFQDELREHIIDNLESFSGISKVISTHIGTMQHALQSVLDSMDTIKIDCGKSMVSLSEKCNTTSNQAYGDCIEFIEKTMKLSFMKDVCSIVDFKSHVCKVLSPNVCIDVNKELGVKTVINHLMLSFSSFENLFNLTITSLNSSSAHSNISESVEKMKTELHNNYDLLFDGVSIFFSIINYIFIFSFLLLVIENISYLNKVLEAKKDVYADLFTCCSQKKGKKQKKSKGCSFLSYILVIGGSGLFALFSTLSDWAVYYSMYAGKVAANNITIAAQAQVNSSLLIEGGPILPPIANSFLEGIKLQHEVKLYLDVNKCMPIPEEPKSYTFWFHICAWYFVVLVSVFCEKKLRKLRYKNIVCFFYPQLKSEEVARKPDRKQVSETSDSDSSSSSSGDNHGIASNSKKEQKKRGKETGKRERKSMKPSLKIFQKKSKHAKNKRERKSEAKSQKSSFSFFKRKNIVTPEKNKNARVIFKKDSKRDNGGENDIVILVEESTDTESTVPSTNNALKDHRTESHFFRRFFGTAKFKPLISNTKENGSSLSKKEGIKENNDIGLAKNVDPAFLKILPTRDSSSSSSSSSSSNSSSSDESTSDSELEYLTADSSA